MQTSLWELQKALLSRLSVIKPTYDKVSADATKPYIVIGDPTMTPLYVKGKAVEDIVLPVHVWSDYNGRKEVYNLFNQILTELHEPLIVDGSFFVLRRDLVTMRAFYDAVEDGVVHGVMEMRFYIRN